MQGTREIKLRARTYGIAAACALGTIAFLAFAAYLGLLNVVSPAVAALLTAAGLATLGVVIPATVNRSARRRARRERARQRAHNPLAGLEDMLARQTDPALTEWVRRHPDGTVAATFVLGIAAGYSNSIRRTLEGILEGMAESERERTSGSE